jgi:hypothetical protein
MQSYAIASHFNGTALHAPMGKAERRRKMEGNNAGRPATWSSQHKPNLFSTNFAILRSLLGF